MRLLHKYILILWIAVCLILGCTDRQGGQTIAMADSLLNKNMADSACNLLNRMKDNVSALTDNQQIRYYYLLGRAYYDKGETPMALHYFHQASDCADTTNTNCDLHTLSRVYGQMAHIFLEQDAPQKAIEQMQQIDRIARKDHDTLMVLINTEQQAIAYETLNKLDTAIQIRQDVSRCFLLLGDTTRAALALGPIIDQIIDKGYYSLAKEYLDRYEKHSGLFDDIGEIAEGYDVYYYTKSLYLLRIHQLDSAEYYARKIFRSSKMSDLEAAYKALYLIYNEKGPKDSLAKYAMLAYEANDSVYRELSTDTYQRMQSLYDYSRHQQLAERNQKERDAFRFGLIVSVVIVLLLIIVLILGYHQYAKRKEKQQQLIEDFAHLQQKKIELEELMTKNQNEYSVQIEEHQATILAMESKIEKQRNTRLYKDLTTIDHALKDADITAIFQKKSLEGKRPTFEEWKKLKEMMNQVAPNFILSLEEWCPQISDMELDICILIRLHFCTNQIAELKNVDKTTVSKIKARLLPKLFKNTTGGAKEFERRILEMY